MIPLCLERYTSANLVINGTWWVGSYGGSRSTRACEAGTGVPQLCELGPFVGFRHSMDGGRHWSSPRGGGAALSMRKTLFGEAPGDSIKIGAPHVVDHGPENRLSPDGKLYMTAMGCFAKSGVAANYNCSWISGEQLHRPRSCSAPTPLPTPFDAMDALHARHLLTRPAGDGIFLARADGFSASEPDSLNDAKVWQFWCGEDCDLDGMEWTSDVARAKPVFSWPGRVGTVTATWHAQMQRYLFAVTTPTTMPSTVGPYDTYVLEAPALTGPFRLVSYMPRFGQQAYFVSFPSRFLDGNTALAVFSANFACKTGGCVPNIAGAGYGASLLPVQFR